MNADAPDYEIDDPRPIAAEAPYTYFLPSEAEIAAVDKGDLVQLTFRYFHRIEKWGAERMWVRVENADADELQGSLQSQPDEPRAPLKSGDAVIFKRHHIIDMVWANPEAAPPPPQHRSYWERCMVDQCVLDGEEPVEFLYRDEPEPMLEGESFPDSGWFIRGRKGNATDAEMDGREVAYVALGAVLNRDDSWIDWIDAPVGTELMRDFETDSYFELNSQRGV